MRSTIGAVFALAAFGLPALGAAFGLAACGNKEATPPALATMAQPAPNATGAAMGVIGSMAGGGNNAAMNAYVADLQKMADAIAAVKDDASAQTAAETIDKLNPELANYAKQLDALTDADKAAAAMARMQDLVAAQQKMAISISNLQMNNPKLLQVFADKVGKTPQVKSN